MLSSSSIILGKDKYTFTSHKNSEMRGGGYAEKSFPGFSIPFPKPELLKKISETIIGGHGYMPHHMPHHMPHMPHMPNNFPYGHMSPPPLYNSPHYRNAMLQKELTAHGHKAEKNTPPPPLHSIYPSRLLQMYQHPIFVRRRDMHYKSDENLDVWQNWGKISECYDWKIRLSNVNGVTGGNESVIKKKIAHIIDTLIRRHDPDRSSKNHCLESEIEIKGSDLIIPINGAINESYFARHTPDRSYGDGVRKKFQVYRTLAEEKWSERISNNDKNSNKTFKRWCTQKTEFEDTHKKKLQIFIEECINGGLSTLFDANGNPVTNSGKSGIEIMFDSEPAGQNSRTTIIAAFGVTRNTDHKINLGGNELFSESDQINGTDKEIKNMSNWKAFSIQYMGGLLKDAYVNYIQVDDPELKGGFLHEYERLYKTTKVFCEN